MRINHQPNGREKNVDSVRSHEKEKKHEKKNCREHEWRRKKKLHSTLAASRLLSIVCLSVCDTSVRSTVNGGNFLLVQHLWKAITAQNECIRCEPGAERNAKRKAIREREMFDHSAMTGEETRIKLCSRNIGSYGTPTFA